MTLKLEWGIRVTSRAGMTNVCVLRTHVSNKLLHVAEASGSRAGLSSENQWPGRGDKTRSRSLWWLKKDSLEWKEWRRLRQAFQGLVGSTRGRWNSLCVSVSAGG